MAGPIRIVALPFQPPKTGFWLIRLYAVIHSMIDKCLFSKYDMTMPHWLRRKRKCTDDPVLVWINITTLEYSLG